MSYTKIQISAESDAEELAPFAMAVHELLGLPVTMRSLHKKGVRLEKGKILDNNYTGPVLEQVLKENKLIRTIPTSGRYTGIPVVVVPIRNKEGYGVAAIGVVDVVGTVDLGLIFGDYPEVVKQVQECVRSRVAVP
ncbi:MAG: DUF2111 domain-containing protein [Candidatus Methanoperedens sp.]|nr:DUF2111 domain-containing protein [Candidatus Methanoperedens sp.]MCZ7358876.1 DUF2111 domain-containing protein [Candidatus Methanoperedens sp.]HLB70923.1 DUF2111 domain-containing protein [Candidatus Methanoperedens sp.]